MAPRQCCPPLSGAGRRGVLVRLAPRLGASPPAPAAIARWARPLWLTENFCFCLLNYSRLLEEENLTQMHQVFFLKESRTKFRNQRVVTPPANPSDAHRSVGPEIRRRR
jgi:hypothetical protein